MANPRILQIVHDHPAFTNGGTEWVAHDLSRALERLGAEVTLLAATTSLSRPDAAPGALERHGRDLLLKTARYDAFSLTRADGPEWVHSMRRVLTDTMPDIVHLHGLDRIGTEIVSMIRSHRPEARIVLTLHDMQLICARDGLMLAADNMLCRTASPDACHRCLPELSMSRHALREALLKAVLAGVDVLLTPSHFLKARFVEWGIPEGKIVVQPNGVLAQPEAALPERGNRFAFFGNTLGHKGVHVLLDAAERLAGLDAPLRITLHGGFPWATAEDKERLAAAVTRAAPVAQHLGPYDRADLPALMAHTDWVVMPSIWWENAPLVILEAQRARRPVICSGIGGMAELIEDGVNGLHVPPGDAAALAETLAGAADTDLCRKLATQSRAPVDTDKMATSHLTLYRSLLEKVPA